MLTIWVPVYFSATILAVSNRLTGIPVLLMLQVNYLDACGFLKLTMDFGQLEDDLLIRHSAQHLHNRQMKLIRAAV